MHVQRKPHTVVRQALPAGTRREQSGQVIQWRKQAIQRHAARTPALPGETPSATFHRVISKRTENVCLALIGSGAVMVFALHVSGLL